MFTGIVEETGRVKSAQYGRITIVASVVLRGLEMGGSIAVNGICLTVTAFDSTSFTVDIMQETSKKTNLGLLRVGDEVNLEPPLNLGKPLGGHLVQGHIDGTGKIVAISPTGSDVLVKFESSPEIMRYIVPKGFVAVDGISFTIVDCDAKSFRISVVDYTWKHTILGRKKVGGLVNLEVDIISKYVERFIQARQQGITTDFLQEHGFSTR